MALDLPPLLTTGRIDRVREQYIDGGCDAMVVTSRSSIRWCCGFTGSYGQLVVTAGGATLTTDNRYLERAGAELVEAGSEAAVISAIDMFAKGAELLGDARKVAFEADAITWAQEQDWTSALDGEAVATRALVTELRSVKDKAEITRMQVAAAIVDDVLTDVDDLLKAGTTERELMIAIEDGMRLRGADGPAYDTVVAAGPNAAVPHALPGPRPFEDGDLVIIDAGARFDGYCSDMTRTFVIGEATDIGREIVSIVTRAQAAGVAAVTAGATTGEVDDACRSIITDAGYGEAFTHGTGHGVGLDIHELPAVRKANTAILQPGHVITVEPGIYLSGVGGVRIEDTVVVTDSGCHPITHSPKAPL